MKKNLRSILILIGFAFILTACSGSGGGSNNPEPPSDFQANVACSGTACTVDFSWNQADYVAGKKFRTVVVISYNDVTYATETYNETSTTGNTASYATPPLVKGRTYLITYYTKNDDGESYSKSISVTPSGTGPNEPTNVGILSTCTSSSNCNVKISWDQADYTPGKDYEATIAVYPFNDLTTPIYTKTDVPITAATANHYTIATSSSTFAANASYKLQIFTVNHYNSTSSATYQSPNFTPYFAYKLKGTGLFVYDNAYDLTAAGCNTGTTTAGTASEFGDVDLRYVYPDLGYVTSVPHASSYSSFQDYVDKTVVTSCGQSASDLGFGYVISANKASGPSISISGSQETSAYDKWQTKSGLAPQVLPIVEFANADAFEHDAATATDVDYLAHAIANVIDEDPNVSGLIVDVEHTPTSATYKQLWYDFFSDLANYLHEYSVSTFNTQKLLSVTASKAFFLAAESSSGQNLLDLFDKDNSSSSCAGRCFAVLPMYDIGTLNGSLADLDNYTQALGTQNSTSPDSTVGVLVGHHVPFQFGIPASASDNNWASANVYGDFSATGIAAGGAVAVDAGGCSSLAGNSCTLVSQQLPSGDIGQADYTCAAVATFKVLTTGSEGSICTPKYTIAASSAISGIDNYFMGGALYRWAYADFWNNQLCDKTLASGKACIVTKPVTLVGSDVGPGTSLNYINQWMAGFSPDP